MTKQELTQLIEPLIQEPFFLVAVELTRGGKGSLVRIILDTDEGITVDQCADWSRELGDLFDVKELFRGRYTLEVTSPGLSRPLSLPRQYRKNIGRLLRVKLQEEEREIELKGRLLTLEEEAILLQLPEAERSIPLREILEAKVEVEI